MTAPPTARVRFDDLSSEEVRVLGCLIEAEVLKPGRYPLRLEEVVTSCNTSKGRDPKVDYDVDAVDDALRGLCQRGLVRSEHGFSRRRRYRHELERMLRLDEAETCVLGVLMLRGPQTLRDLRKRCEPQFEFDSLEELTAVVKGLASRAEPLVGRTEQRSGSDVRWTHWLQAIELGGEGIAARLAAAEPTLGLLDPDGEATVEFHDLLPERSWSEVGERLARLLAGIDTTAGPLIDLGAGTGAGLVPIRLAVRSAEVFAIEPSKALRSALHARLAIHPELCRSVTVDPRPFADAALPERACGVVGVGVLGHLTDTERTALWRYVVECLPAGAPLVIEVPPPERPIDVPSEQFAKVTVGRHTYEGWRQGAPDDVERMLWTRTYRVYDGPRRVAEHRVQSRWRCLGKDDLRAEIGPLGLELVEPVECGDLVVVRRPRF